MPALQLSIGCGVQGDLQRPWESFIAEFKESDLWFALLILHTERIVLLVFHAISSLTGRRPRILHLLTPLYVEPSYLSWRLSNAVKHVTSYRRRPTLISGLSSGSVFLLHRGHLISVGRSKPSSSAIGPPFRYVECNSPEITPVRVKWAEATGIWPPAGCHMSPSGTLPFRRPFSNCPRPLENVLPFRYE